jgi:predicted nuclease with TOPRIM domain
MTLQECKNEIAHLYGFRDWDSVDFYAIDCGDEIMTAPYAEQRLMNEAAELYAYKQRLEHNDEIRTLTSQYIGLKEAYELEQEHNIELVERIEELEDALELKEYPHGKSSWDEPDPGDLTEYHGEPDEE